MVTKSKLLAIKTLTFTLERMKLFALLGCNDCLFFACFLWAGLSVQCTVINPLLWKKLGFITPNSTYQACLVNEIGACERERECSKTFIFIAILTVSSGDRSRGVVVPWRVLWARRPHPAPGVWDSLVCAVGPFLLQLHPSTWMLARSLICPEGTKAIKIFLDRHVT